MCVCVRLIYFGSRIVAGLHPSIKKTVGSTSAMALPQGGTAGSMATDLMFGVAPIAFEWAQARQAETRPGSQVLGFSKFSFGFGPVLFAARSTTNQSNAVMLTALGKASLLIRG